MIQQREEAPYARERSLPDIVKACECLKAWWKKDLNKQQEA
jgi:hypothetical protein